MKLLIKRIDNDEVIETIDCGNKHRRYVEKVEDGVTRNMDVENFYTEIVENEHQPKE